MNTEQGTRVGMPSSYPASRALAIARSLRSRFNLEGMRKPRRKANPRPPAAGEHERDDVFANPLADKLRGIDKEIRRSRSRRASVESVPREAAPSPATPADADLFREAAAGAKALSCAPARVTARPALSPSKEPAASRYRDFDPTGDEHFDFRFSDLYVQGRAAGVSRETVAKLSRGEFAVRSHVDLHGMALDDAKEAVDQFLAERQKRGDRCVLVITGKGKNSRGQIAVLRERIPEWLGRGPSARRVLAFVTARPCDGGEGAFYVLLRRSVSRKMRIDVEAGGGS
jgi:DNA-nicking Smr family endonuclease